MSNKRSRKLISLILSALIAGSSLATAVFADTPSDGGSAGSGSTSGSSGGLTDITELMSTLTYTEYLEMNAGATDAKTTFDVEISKETVTGTAPNFEILNKYEGSKGAVVHTGSSGLVTFNINVPETGYYSLAWEYMPVKPGEGELESTTAIERTLYVDDKVPFSEARFVAMNKKWVATYNGDNRDEAFNKDTNGNELRPDRNIAYEWQEYVFSDSNGYYLEPLKIFLEEGEHTIALEAVRQDAYITNMQFFHYEGVRSYEDALKEWESKGYQYYDGDPIYIDAETPKITSHYAIYPVNDPTSSVTEPQSASVTYRNYISSSEVGEWIEYSFTVPKSAIYTFTLRFWQDVSQTPVNRKIIIDGKVPYDEAQYAKFEFSDNWQADHLKGSNGDVLKFYLEEGVVHTIRFEVTVGEVGELLRKVTAVQSALNSDYLEIIRLTGASPDEYRDYGFSRVLPNVMRDLVAQSKVLTEVIDYLNETGELSSGTSTLTQIRDRIESMGKDESQVAKNLDSLKNDLSSLGSWVTSMLTQYLGMDYILVQSPDGDIPKADSGFFGGTWYEIQKFWYSFFIDYNSLSNNTEEVEMKDSIEIWSQTSRDQVQIIKDLVESQFTPKSNIPVTVKLVAGGTLLPSVLAGIGPDVALDGMASSAQVVAAQGAGSIIDYAVRGAILPINQFEDFEDVKATIYAQAFEAVTLDDPTTGEDKVYGVPVTLDWQMMFYRKDILAALEIGIPQTWDDVLSSVPVLQFNNMQIGLTRDVGTYASLIFQKGGDFWADNGMRVNFDANTSLEAFEYMVNMFTQYSLPLNFDGVNRFKTGEIPLFLAGYTTYNQITLFATELSGLWGFDSIPGMLQDDGSINRQVIGTSDCVTMLRGCEAPSSAWEFMKWYSAAEFQSEYSNELVNLLGEAGMRSVASKGALENLQWKESDREALIAQAESVICMRQYPGSYFITRYIEFAVNNAYNEGADPVEELLGYIPAINKEISRKRSEFGYETLAIGQTLAEKRVAEAKSAIEALSDADRETYKDVIAEALESLEAGELDELRHAANILEDANEELFKSIAKYIDDAAEALKSYKL